VFVAFDKTAQIRVTTLAPEWKGRIEVLRETARQERLVCPGCEQSLWLRTGGNRRPHFAHRVLKDCRFGRESAAVMEAKARLYDWLQSKYPGKVELDVEIKIRGWDKPADVLAIEPKGKKFVYWIFERQQRNREALLLNQNHEALRLHFLHVDNLEVHRVENGAISLTPSQRDFIACCEYDKPFWPGGHLYFIDGLKGELTIYRGLQCIHAPNLYGWKCMRKEALSTAKISPGSGQIVFPEDIEELQLWKARQAARVAKPAPLPEVSKAQPNPFPLRQPDRVETEDGDEITDEISTKDSIEESESEEEAPAVAPEQKEEDEQLPNLQGPFRCEDCGKETTEWSQACPSQGTCVCRECTKKRWEAKRKAVRT
jgi:hypothetical protein